MKKKIRRVLAENLSEKEKILFLNDFYLRDTAPDDQGSSTPWGCPWHFGFPVELRGSTIKEMVDNYIDDYGCDFFNQDD